MQAEADQAVVTQTEAGNAPQALASAAGTYVTFDLAGQVLGVEVRHVREILDRINVNRLPNAGPDVEGVINIRGESIPIVDMGSRLGLPRNEDGEDTRIIVFEVSFRDALRPLGVLADRVRDVTYVGAEDIEAPPEIAGSTWEAQLLRGLARQNGALILLLNLGHVFQTSEDVPTLDPMYM